MNQGSKSPRPKQPTPARCVVSYDPHTNVSVPWVVMFGRLAVSRHPSQPAAEITARKLNRRMRIKDSEDETSLQAIPQATEHCRD